MINKLPPSDRFPHGRFLVCVTGRSFGKKEVSVPIIRNRGAKKIDITVNDKVFSVTPTRSGVEDFEIEIKNFLHENWDKKKRCSLKILTVGDALNEYDKTRTWGDSKFNLLMDRLGHVPIDEVWWELEDLIEELKETITIRGTVHTNGNINRHISMCKAAITKVYETRSRITKTRLIPENYLSKFPSLKENNTDFRILTFEQKLNFWNNLCSFLKPLYYFACTIPIRLSEAVNIKREHIHRFTDCISIPLTKNGKFRNISIPGTMMPYIDEFLDSPAEYFFNKGYDYNYHSLGYWSKKHKRIVFDYRDLWDAACVDANIFGYNIHKTRQEAALNLFQEGYDVAQIMVLGGWESKKAFDRYFDYGVSILIKEGKRKMDLSWKEQFACDLLRKAA